jgi:hypothetical protein
MAIAFLYFGLSVAIGIWASNRGRNGLGWFGLSLILSPLLACVFLAVTKNLSHKNSNSNLNEVYVRCSKCAEFVLPQANICNHCGSNLGPNFNYLENKIDKNNSKNELLITDWILIAVIGLILMAGISQIK